MDGRGVRDTACETRRARAHRQSVMHHRRVVDFSLSTRLIHRAAPSRRASRLRADATDARARATRLDASRRLSRPRASPRVAHLVAK